MCKATRILRTFIADESGQDLIEYALMAGLVAMVAVAAITPLTDAITTAFGKVAAHLNSIT